MTSFALADWRQTLFSGMLTVVLLMQPGLAVQAGDAETPAVPSPEEISMLNTHDALTKARLAAIEGGHEACARLADHARRQRDASWHAHHVFATCEVYAADDAKDEIGQDAYRKRIREAIGALQFLLNTPGILIYDQQRNSVELIVSELRKKIAD